MTGKIKALVVDDALSIRLMLKSMLSAAPGIEVVATAKNGKEALQMLKEHKPDVVTLDVEMPEMDGIECLQKIMSLFPTPVVMISTLTGKGSATALKALAIGAVEVFGKPSQQSSDLDSYRDEIIQKVTAAAHARVSARAPRKEIAQTPNLIPSAGANKTILIDDFMPPVKMPKNTAKHCIAIGSSTGGTEALKAFMAELSAPCPPIFVVQHIAVGFSAAFAASLDKKTSLTVVEAENGMIATDNHVYIAPATHHLCIRQVGEKIRCNIIDGPRINRHRPSADVLLRSVTSIYGKNAIGVILTGMGDDGARALKEMRDHGATTYAQDEATSLVYGMPKAAREHGGAQFILPLTDIPKHIKHKGKK